MTCSVTPHTRESLPCKKSTTSACSSTSMPGSSLTATSAAPSDAISAREISLPVASPPAWAIRSRPWPPSLVSEISPSGPRANWVPGGPGPTTPGGRPAPPARPRDPVPAVAALSGQRDLAVGPTVELGPEGHEPTNTGRTLGDQDAHCLFVADRSEEHTSELQS